MTRELKHIFSGIAVETVTGSMDRVIDKIEFDSRKADSSSVFFAIKGTTTDGHLFLPQVVANGCQVLVVQEIPDILDQNCTIILVNALW